MSKDVHYRTVLHLKKKRRVPLHPSSPNTQLKFSGKGLVSLARLKSCACSWLGLASQETSGLSQKAQGEDRRRAETVDSTSVVVISPEQQRIVGNNLLLKGKDNAAIIPTNF